MKNSVVFIGEDNRTNSELYQLLNWRFKVQYYHCIEDDVVDNIVSSKPAIIIVNIAGSTINYYELFEAFREKCADISVVTICTETESSQYETFYKTEQFVRILRPITGRKVLEICRALINGKSYTETEEQSSAPKEKQHILVVDDNAMVLRNMKGILESSYSVAVAPSGFHAFISIGKKMPDLILLDYEMPEMNGKDVMEKLQSDDELKEIPIVFLTSVDSKEIVMKLLALNPAGYILKPVDSNRLLDKIAEIIGK